jgi:hypothetical protein
MSTTDTLTGTLYRLVQSYDGRYYASIYERQGKAWTPVERQVSERTFNRLVVANSGRLIAEYSDRVVRLYGGA